MKGGSGEKNVKGGPAKKKMAGGVRQKIKIWEGGRRNFPFRPPPSGTKME